MDIGRLVQNDEHNLLESVIHITEERDKRSLLRVLAEVLSDLIDLEALIILNVPKGAGDEYLEVAVSAPDDAYKDKLSLIPYDYGDQRVNLDDAISLCIKNREIHLETFEGKSRVLFPIVVNNLLVGVLDIYGHRCTRNTKKLICSFLRIYSNFLAILDDNEHDTLTNLLNRKTFDAQLSKLILDTQNNSAQTVEKDRRASKTDVHHWVGILDIDHFKVINDNFGHMYGDEVLLLFADLMKKSFRSNDLLFRYGGEEFIVVLTPTTESDAFMVFDRFRQELESFEFPQVGKVTVSIGFVKIDEQQHNTTLLEHADQSLYYAKEHGRNQVCSYHALTKAGQLKVRNIESDIELF